MKCRCLQLRACQLWLLVKRNIQSLLMVWRLLLCWRLLQITESCSKGGNNVQVTEKSDAVSSDGCLSLVVTELLSNHKKWFDWALSNQRQRQQCACQPCCNGFEINGWVINQFWQSLWLTTYTLLSSDILVHSGFVWTHLSCITIIKIIIIIIKSKIQKHKYINNFSLKYKNEKQISIFKRP